MSHRVQFDFEIDFSNGGGIQGQDFRLDIAGDDISDAELADYLVRDMRLLMVGYVRILNKRVLTEAHKRPPRDAPDHDAGVSGGVFVDLSHTIEHGLVTYKGLPAPIICDYLSRETSRALYAPGTEFQIGKIEMVANTGTYIDCPFHRYADGDDLSQVGIKAMCDLDAIVVRADHREARRGEALAIDALHFGDRDLRGRAVLVHTGWDTHWNSPAYFEGNPFLTEDAAVHLRDAGVRLVGIDSHNIDDTSRDDTRGKSRPVHTILLGAGILIVEHLTNLAALPDAGFTFSAVPPKFKGVGTFPVRAHAKLR